MTFRGNQRGPGVKADPGAGGHQGAVGEVLVGVGVDPVVFGVIFVTSCALGAIHPPVGLSLFIACGISGAKIEEASLAVVPFMIAKIVDIIILSIFPGIALLLPHWLGIY